MVSPSETAVRLSRRRGTSAAPLLIVVLSLSAGCCPNTNVPETAALKAETEKLMCMYLLYHACTVLPVRDTELPLPVTPPLIA